MRRVSIVNRGSDDMLLKGDVGRAGCEHLLLFLELLATSLDRNTEAKLCRLLLVTR